MKLVYCTRIIFHLSWTIINIEKNVRLMHHTREHCSVNNYLSNKLLVYNVHEFDLTIQDHQPPFGYFDSQSQCQRLKFL